MHSAGDESMAARERGGCEGRATWEGEAATTPTSTPCSGGREWARLRVKGGVNGARPCFVWVGCARRALQRMLVG